jgi:hypothetical protein
VRCSYCGTTSVVSQETLVHASELLQREERDLRARSIGAVNRTAAVSVHMRRTLVVCFVLTYAAIFGLIWVVQLLAS